MYATSGLKPLCLGLLTGAFEVPHEENHSLPFLVLFMLVDDSFEIFPFRSTKTFFTQRAQRAVFYLWSNPNKSVSLLRQEVDHPWISIAASGI